MRRRLAGLVAVLLAGVAVAAWAQQGQPRPGPGTGVVTVDGIVNLGNAPAMTQEGDWRVAVANTPSVNVATMPSVNIANIAAPAFVTTGKRYQIVWPTGESEQITAAATGTGAWVKVAGPERWVNLGQARSVTLLP
jgi:hypothetical protein